MSQNGCRREEESGDDEEEMKGREREKRGGGERVGKGRRETVRKRKKQRVKRGQRRETEGCTRGTDRERKGETDISHVCEKCVRSQSVHLQMLFIGMTSPAPFHDVL